MHRCDFCGEARGLLAPFRGGHGCADCWKKAGSPFQSLGSIAEVHAAEVATRERMQKRGGADLHMVRAGKS